MSELQPCRLYLITPPKIELNALVTQFQYACDGGDIAALQVRLKEDDGITPASDKIIASYTEALVEVCRAREVALIINDCPHLVVDSGADGVHIGQTDQTATNNEILGIRDMLGDNYVIGVSCYNSQDYAITAAEQEANYISFGAFYPSKTKPQAVQAEPKILGWWYDNSTVPAAAIGGITPENCGELVSAGANFICASSGVWEHEQGPKQAVTEYNQSIAERLSASDEEFFVFDAVNDNSDSVTV
jgi:thiamine-phosphate pyrophosphorylase